MLQGGVKLTAQYCRYDTNNCKSYVSFKLPTQFEVESDIQLLKRGNSSGLDEYLPFLFKRWRWFNKITNLAP